MLLANSIIRGTITNANSGDPLPGANVMVKNSEFGAASNSDGQYVISNVAVTGLQTIVATMIGYRTVEKTVNLPASGTVTVDFQLQAQVLRGEAIAVVADRAKERETPVAFTNVEKEQLSFRLGSRDLPLAMNVTPSVYSTQQGGGAGDARITVRGFNQRNVAIMINGVPVNDMENGWVYWSNWDGIGDATSSIQMQRGLSAVNLATPSIGGTMNIITDPAAQEAGGKLKQEYGSGNFLKTTLMGSTGLVNGKYALNGVVVRKTGDGIVDGTWIDAWAYYLGAAYNINKNNRLELYAMGAPQKHGQNLYMQNIAVYDTNFAKDLITYKEAAFSKYHQVGRYYNQNWAPVNTTYNGKQYLIGDITSRYSPTFLNERENIYHKPQVNLNWYSKLTDKFRLSTVAYYSGGTGGGTGTLGDIEHSPRVPGNAWYNSLPWEWNWNKTIAMNDTSSTGSLGIIRDSRNNQWTLGAIVKGYYDISNALKMTAGIDWRTAQIEHYREVFDLLGGNYYINTTNDYDTTLAMQKKGLGDKVDYNFTNTVNWIGAFAQAEYTLGRITAYGMGGYSTIAYTYANHFRTADTLANGKPDFNSGELKANTGSIGGYQVKGGASYRITEALDIYGNVGYVSKVPIFDQVINDRTGTKAKNPKNEKFESYEAGVNFNGLDGKLSAKGSFYYTTWKDRSNSISITNQDGSEGIIFLTGMNELHSGVEIEGAYRPIHLLRLDAAASFGNWHYTKDVSGVYKDYASGGANDEQYNFYVKNLKVGDAPQTQVTLGATLYPVKGGSVELVVRHYGENFAGWDPFSRTNEIYPAQGGDRGVQSWRAPDYTVTDLHLAYLLPVDFNGVNIKFTGHIFNLLNNVYVQDAIDNSQYNAWDNNHSADDAEVFLGLPTHFNAGMEIIF